MFSVEIETETDDYTSPAIHAPRTRLPIHDCHWLESPAPEGFLPHPSAIQSFQPVEIQIQPEIQAAFNLMAFATPPKRRAIDIDEESARDNKRSCTRSLSPASSLDSVKVEFEEAEWEELAAARTTEHRHPYSPSTSPTSSAPHNAGLESRSPSPASSVSPIKLEDELFAGRATGHHHPYSPSPSPASHASHGAGVKSRSSSLASSVDSVKLEVDEDGLFAGRATDVHQVRLQETSYKTSARLIKPLPSRLSEIKPFSFGDFVPLRVLYGAPTNPLPPIQSLGAWNSQRTTTPSTSSLFNNTTSTIANSKPFSFADFVPLPLLYGGRAIPTLHNAAEEFDGTDSEYSEEDSDEDDFEIDSAFAAGGVPMMREDPFDRLGVF